MKVYKITTRCPRTGGELILTYGNTVWEVGQIKRIKEENLYHPSWGINRLCTEGVFHAYETLPQMMTFRCLHGFGHPIWDIVHKEDEADFFKKNFRLWEAEGDLIVRGIDKAGLSSLVLLKEIELPKFSTNLLKRGTDFVNSPDNNLHKMEYNEAVDFVLKHLDDLSKE